MSENDKKSNGFEIFEDHSARHEEVGEVVPEIKHEAAESSNAELSQSEQIREAKRSEAFRESVGTDELKKKLEASQRPAEDDVARRPITTQVMNSALANQLRQVRRKLSKGDRLGSKIIHQPIVKTVSEVSSKTMTRPSGLLGGGITAFLGTTAYLFITKYIGLKYNYSVFLFLLVAGFILGLIIEAVFRVTKGRSTS